ncbi:hypothetical protein V491_05527 [Pseudogymnoascus sp. VKM F-3775]|nr:hypothetical protein V491_05527 [Pseudogymnoascus sp. VKM F-3775]
MDQESQNNTDVRDISIEERLGEKTIEQQCCQQKKQEDEDKGDTEATSGKDKGPISYCQQINKTLQHQRVEDETIVTARLSQLRQHSVKRYHEEIEDNEDDEDEDVQPPRRRKRRQIDSDATETATCKKVHMCSSTMAQAQTCATQRSTVSLSSPGDEKLILGADYQEYPPRSFLKCGGI